MILGKKTLRDMRKGMSQFTVLFLMVFIGVFAYTGIAGEVTGMQKTVDSYYRETNLADVWIYSSSGFSDADTAAVLNLGEVSQVQRRTKIDAKAALSGTPAIDLYVLEDNIISKPYLKSGVNFTVDIDGIWIDERFAAARGLGIGDSVTLEFNGFALIKEIKGIVISPEYVYAESETMTPDFNMQGYAFIPYSAVRSNPLFVWSQLLIKTGTADFGGLEDEIREAVNGGYSVLITRDNHSSVMMFQSEITQHKSMAAMFPPVFLIVALLIILTTMARLISVQRTQIGTLKALGFSDKKIMLHYLGYGFFLPFAAAILGVILGPLLLPPLFYPSMSSFYTMPYWRTGYDISFYIVGAATVLLCAATAFCACKKILRYTPAESLRPKPPKMIKAKNGGSKLVQKLGFNVQWNLRDIRRNKVRSVMAVIGALGCSMLLICAFGMKGDMNDQKIWQYEQIYKYETKVLLAENITDGQTQGILTDANGVDIMETAIEVRTGKGKKTGELLVTDGSGLIQFTDKNRKDIPLDYSGVNISYKMAQQLGVSVGDTVEWHIFTEEGWKSTAVIGIYRSPLAQGLTMSKAVLAGFGYQYKPTAVITAEHFAGETHGSNVLYKSEMYSGWDDITESFMLMVYVLIGCAVVLALTVLYNLGVLSFTEMEREYATLKVLGFGVPRICWLMLTQNLFLTFIGFVIGVPLGLLMTNEMMSEVGDSFDMIAKLHFTDIVYSLLITLGVSVLTTLLFARKLQKLDMVSALKSAE